MKSWLKGRKEYPFFLRFSRNIAIFSMKTSLYQLWLIHWIGSNIWKWYWILYTKRISVISEIYSAILARRWTIWVMFFQWIFRWRVIWYWHVFFSERRPHSKVHSMRIFAEKKACSYQIILQRKIIVKNMNDSVHLLTKIAL